MPTPREGYFKKDGTQVPSTTTITGRFKPSERLIGWAWNQGRKGLNCYATRDEASEKGTSVHSLIEGYLRDRSASTVCEDPGTQIAYHNFRHWEDQNPITVIDQEIHLVSEMYGYGGTPDVYGYEGDGCIDDLSDICLFDWKTGSELYPEVLLQMAAYVHLLKECLDVIAHKVHVLRFDKKKAGLWEHLKFKASDLVAPFDQFIIYKRAYENEPKIKAIFDRAYEPERVSA